MENKAIFEHRVSRGSRFNQIYIPKGMETFFEVGDVVEVRLLEKKNQIFYSKNLGKIGEFKEEIANKILSILKNIKGIIRIFIFGSFLTEKSDYNDIDIILVSDVQEIEKKAYNLLVEKIQLKFHIISIPEKNFQTLLQIDPLTRSMLYYFISDKKFELPKETRIDKDHIKFLLMMPEDLLKVQISSSRFYLDNLRKLITVLRFLKKEELDSIKINLELKSSLRELYDWSKNNESLNQQSYKKLKSLILIKLKEAKKLLNE